MRDDDRCEQPRQIERDVDEMLWPAVNEMVGPTMGAVLLVWLIVGILLHAGSWLAGGTGGAALSFAVAAWGMVPGLIGPLIGLLLLYHTMEPVTVSPGTDPATAIEPMMAQLEALRPVVTGVTLFTTAWSGIIWRYGLEHKRGLDAGVAWMVAGIVAVLFAIFAIL